MLHIFQMTIVLNLLRESDSEGGTWVLWSGLEKHSFFVCEVIY